MLHRRRALGALVLGVLGLAGLTGCDNTVNIRIIQINLQDVFPAGNGYTPEAASEGGGDCMFNPNSFDVKLLLLGNTRTRTLEMIQDGDLLGECTFAVGEGVSDDKTCYFNAKSLDVVKSTVERLSRPCDSQSPCDDGWSCNQYDRLCEAPIDLTVKSVEYHPVGNPNADKGRIVSLVVDNSGSIAGISSVGEHTESKTDPENDRLAAATIFVKALGPDDRVGVYALSGSGSDGVIFKSLELSNGRGTGFLPPTSGVVTQAIGELQRGAQGGTPIWDGIIQAVRDMDGAVDLDHYVPSIVLFTDGYKKQDLDGAEAQVEYGPDATFDDALAAVTSGPYPIPVFIVHLENKVRTPLGRDPKLAQLACASGGAYYYVTDPVETKTPYQKFFEHMTRGYYLAHFGYQALRLDDRFPAGEDYAINATVNVTIGGRSVPFHLEDGNIRGMRFDSRVFVRKEAQ